MQTIRSFETSGTTRQMTEHHFAVNLNPHELSLQTVPLNATIENLLIEDSRTPFIRINWDGESSEYAETPDN